MKSLPLKGLLITLISPLTMAGSHGLPYASHRARDTDTRHSYPVINHKASKLKDASYHQTKVRNWSRFIILRVLPLSWMLKNKILKITREFMNISCWKLQAHLFYKINSSANNICAIIWIKLIWIFKGQRLCREHFKMLSTNNVFGFPHYSENVLTQSSLQGFIMLKLFFHFIISGCKVSHFSFASSRVTMQRP